jgi:hypothetical protein
MEARLRVRVTYTSGTVVEFDGYTMAQINDVRRSWAQITYPDARRPKIEIVG